jgi:hypothetical protein
MTGWKEHPSQQKAKKRGSATVSFSDIQKQLGPKDNWDSLPLKMVVTYWLKVHFCLGMINYTYLMQLFITFTVGFPLSAFLTVDLETNTWLKRGNPWVAQGHFLRFWRFTFAESNCAFVDYGYLLWGITCYISCDSVEIVQRLRLSLRDSIIFMKVSFYRTVLRLWACDVLQYCYYTHAVVVLDPVSTKNKLYNPLL